MRESFFICINAVIPAFILMIIGYVCKLRGYIDRETAGKFNKVVFRFFLSVSLFYSIYNSDLNQAFNPKLISYITMAVFAEYFIALFMSSRITDERNRRGVIIQGMFRANTAVVGLPIATALLGDVDLGPVIIAIALVVPIFNVMAVLSLEIFSGESTSAKKVIKGIITNPLIIGTVSAIIVVLLKIKLPGVILSTIKTMSQAANPILLFLVGASFSFDRVSKSKKELIITTLFRLVVFPGIFMFIGYIMGFRGAEFVSLLVVFASSTAVSSFTMAQQLGGDADLAGNIIVLTSLLCPFTIFAWSFLYKVLGMF